MSVYIYISTSTANAIPKWAGLSS